MMTIASDFQSITFEVPEPWGVTALQNGGFTVNSVMQKVSAAAACTVLALGLGVGGAQANSVELEPVEVSKSEMKFVGFDKKVAAANGYDIRKDAQGVEYSIPASTPKGEMTGAVYGPGTEPKVSTGEFTTLDSRFADGNCGTSSLVGSGKSFTTTYTINWWLGPSARHTWKVAVASGYGYQVYNLSGWFGGSGWIHQQAIAFKGLPYNAYVSEGTVVTAAGFVCSSMRPSDSWYGY